jgi:uncharacterized membrane protein
MSVTHILLGLALASASGLRSFLPLLVLASGARFGHIPLNAHFAWLESNAALGVLAVAAVAELLADKIPVVDHALDVLQTVVRPAAGALVMAGAQTSADPMTAAVLAIIVGAPLAGGIHVAKGGVRVLSTATTGGVANPLISAVEDAIALTVSLLAVLAPVAAVALVILLILPLIRFVRRRRGMIAARRTRIVQDSAD